MEGLEVYKLKSMRTKVYFLIKFQNIHLFSLLSILSLINKFKVIRLEPGLGQVTGPGNVSIKMKSSPVLKLISLVRLYMPACHTNFFFLTTYTITYCKFVKCNKNS